MKTITKNVLKTAALGLILGLSLTGCGGGGDTYVTEAPLLPDTPTDGAQIIVTADNGGTSGLSYTNVGDGSILVDCGSGGCGDVYTASPVTPAATTTTP